QMLNLAVTRVGFNSQEHVPLFVDIVGAPLTRQEQISRIKLVVADATLWPAYRAIVDPMAEPVAVDETTKAELLQLLEPAVEAGRAVAIFFPRGVGPHTWHGDERKQIQIQRRFQLLGMTADGMRVWDIRRASQTLRLATNQIAELTLTDQGQTGQLVLLAGLFEPESTIVRINNIAMQREQQPAILNFSRVATPDQLQSLVNAGTSR
ncbi:MAG: hypothetical protein KDA85_06090, partial [Planctomycetaceae bacterium]|nr:hypothetical protein [Planctomycetaceae bacterium]